MLSGQGRIQGFPKGGVETRDTKCGGGGGGAARFRPDTKSGGRGCCPLQARYEKRMGGGGGGAVHLRPDTKSGWGGGGGGCCPALQARYKKRGRGRGCLAEEGALPYMKGGVATPKPPPPPPPPGSASAGFRLYKLLLELRCIAQVNNHLNHVY